MKRNEKGKEKLYKKRGKLKTIIHKMNKEEVSKQISAGW